MSRWNAGVRNLGDIGGSAAQWNQVGNAARAATHNGITNAFSGTFARPGASGGGGRGYLHDGVEAANNTLERMDGGLATNLYNRNYDISNQRDADMNARTGAVGRATPDAVQRAAGQVGFQNNILRNNQNITREESALNQGARNAAFATNESRRQQAMADAKAASSGGSFHVGGRSGAEMRANKNKRKSQFGRGGIDRSIDKGLARLKKYDKNDYYNPGLKPDYDNLEKSSGSLYPTKTPLPAKPPLPNAPSYLYDTSFTNQKPAYDPYGDAKGAIDRYNNPPPPKQIPDSTLKRIGDTSNAVTKAQLNYGIKPRFTNGGTGYADGPFNQNTRGY